MGNEQSSLKSADQLRADKQKADWHRSATLTRLERIKQETKAQYKLELDEKIAAAAAKRGAASPELDTSHQDTAIETTEDGELLNSTGTSQVASKPLPDRTLDASQGQKSSDPPEASKPLQQFGSQSANTNLLSGNQSPLVSRKRTASDIAPVLTRD